MENMENKLQMAVFADLQYFEGNEPYKDTVLGFHGRRFMDHFQQTLLKQENPPDLILDLGDRITSQSARGVDEHNMLIVNAWMDHLVGIAPVVSIEGNHDAFRLQKHFASAASPQRLQKAQQSHVTQINGFSVLSWCPEYIPSAYYKRTDIWNPADIEWLEDTLHSQKDPVIVVSHIPLCFKKDRVYTYQGHDPETDFYAPETEFRIQRIIADSGNVVLCLAGHIHAQLHELMHDIPHVTLSSPTVRTVDDHTEPTMAHYRIDLVSDYDGNQCSIHVKASGQDTYDLFFNMRKTPEGFKYEL